MSLSVPLRRTLTRSSLHRRLTIVSPLRLRRSVLRSPHVHVYSQRGLLIYPASRFQALEVARLDAEQSGGADLIVAVRFLHRARVIPFSPRGHSSMPSLGLCPCARNRPGIPTAAPGGYGSGARGPDPREAGGCRGCCEGPQRPQRIEASRPHGALSSHPAHLCEKLDERTLAYAFRESCWCCRSRAGWFAHSPRPPPSSLRP